MAMESAPTDDRRLREGQTTVEWLPAELARLHAARLVRRPFEATEALLRRRPDQLVWLAYSEGVDASVGVISLSVHPLVPWMRIPVRIETFTPVDAHRGALLSIRWTPIRMSGLLPTMDADLFVRPHGPEFSELELEGQYRPPLGLAGLVFDHLVGRLVARETARTFLDLFAGAIETA